MSVPALRRKAIALILFTAASVAVLVYLYQAAGGRLRTSEPYNAKALIPDTFNIVTNSDVRRDGVTIGRVRRVEPKGGVSEVKFEIEKEEQAPIYRDATVRVRIKTLVGESYLDVDPGTPKAGDLPKGATLPLEAVRDAVPLERILNALDPTTRRSVQRNLRGLGAGLDGRGSELNELFGALRPTVADGGRLMDVLKPQRRELAALVDNTGAVMQALGERTRDLRSLVVDAKGTAEAVAARDARLRESLRELPATLDRVKATVNKLSAFAPRATPVFHDLSVASVDLAPALADLEPAARDGRKLFRELPPFLDAVDPLLARLSPASRRLRTVIGPLDALLRQAQPALHYLKPYYREFGSFFSNVASAVDTRDALGYRGRVFPVGGDQQLTSYPPELRKLADAFINAGGLYPFHGTRMNAYPKPGTVGSPQPFDGRYDRVEARP